MNRTGLEQQDDSWTSRRLDTNRFFIALASILVCLTGLTPAVGELIATELADVDDDYAWTGEFRGNLQLDNGEQHKYGLQVYATGDGTFGAALLPGGLPGNGWNRQRRLPYSGSLLENKLQLHSDSDASDWVLHVGARATEVFHASGKSLGKLEKVVRRSVYEGMEPPPNSYVLFEGDNTAAFDGAEVKNGLLQAGTRLTTTFRNYQLHVEFLLPYMPDARSQGRANSGVYLQSRYEVQILDSFGLKGVKNECGALYRQRAPDINMAFPPLRWQTYDITFHAPLFDANGNKVVDARLTVLHNGVKIHDNVRVQSKTGAGKPEGPEALPIRFQDHSNPVQFRNIWLLEL